MIVEKEKINKFLENKTFECSCSGFLGSGIDFDFEYRFLITGEKKMISVGEWYMYTKVDVEILNLDDKLKKICSIFGRDFDKETFIDVFFKKDYMVFRNITDCIGEILHYFNIKRLMIDELTISQDLYDEIIKKET